MSHPGVTDLFLTTSSLLDCTVPESGSWWSSFLHFFRNESRKDTCSKAVLRVSDAFGHLGTAIGIGGLRHPLVHIESVDSLKCDLLKCLSYRSGHGGGWSCGSCRNACVSYICFIFSSNESNQNICFIFPPKPKKPRENQTFLALWAENQKNIEKTKKNKKNKTTRPNGYIGLNFLVSLFFLVFSRFLLLWAENQKKPRENPKKTKKQNYQTQWVHRVELFGFFGFFGFLEVFCYFGQKTKKTSRKPKKNKKKQNYQTQWVHRVELFGFFGFFGFLEVFATLGRKPKRPRENKKKPTKPKLPDPMGT